jgi:arylsulfatase A-like enzyme
MSDDHAVNAINCYGSIYAPYINTPNIDRIAAEGMKLDNCFCTNSICTPSRATILTGQYSHINGVLNLGNPLDRDKMNVAKYLQDAGYQTAMIGKWHLKTEPSGFDYYNVLPGQGNYGVINTVMLKEKGQPWEDGKNGGAPYVGYVSDIIGDLSIQWLENRDKDKPFCLMSQHKAPHGKWEYNPKYENLFDGVTWPEPANFLEDKSHRSSASMDAGRDMLELAGRMVEAGWPTGQMDTTGMDDTQKKRAAFQKYMNDYMRCIASVDENVGKLLDWLDENDLADNTVVIYTADQGMFLGEHDYYDKRWIFEDAFRMPFLVRYPVEIAPGSENNDLINNTDFAPTLLDFAGRDTPDDMQGSSFREILKGNTPFDWRKSTYYRYWMGTSGVPKHYGIRTNRYKLIYYNDDPAGWEMYDLQVDPFEMNNVYDDPTYATVVTEMTAELARVKAEVGDTG